jgi:hypothetical protein
LGVPADEDKNAAFIEATNQFFSLVGGRTLKGPHFSSSNGLTSCQVFCCKKFDRTNLIEINVYVGLTILPKIFVRKIAEKSFCPFVLWFDIG